MAALRYVAAWLQRVVDKLDPQTGRYRMLFEASPLPMWVVDTARLRFLAVNEAALRLYGYTREEFLEMHAEALWPSEERAALRHFVRRDEAEVQRGIFRQVKKSGELLYVEGVANLVMWRGRLARLAMLGDVSDRVRAKEALERLNRELEDRVRSRTAQLEAANRELEAFSYSVSHDLRAPVRHIDGFVKLLERELPAATDKAGHYLRTIAHSSRRMGALIDDLLALSRTARTPLETRIVPLNELLDDVLREMSPDTASRRIKWRIERLPAVHGDASLLRVLLQNLLSNAVKYTRPRSTAVIEVGVERLENGETVVFVRDNGVGFDMRHADRLFGVFQRLHRDEDFEGTGVGLATARRIVHRHGGRIWGEGEPERGATFRFTVNPVPEHA